MTQARRFGAEILAPQEATALRVKDPYRIVTLADGNEISAEALLIATGVQWRKLDVPGMDRLTGAGVYYGAGSTEALSCRDDDVYIVGGANSAGQAALNFSRYARRVVMLVRGESLAASMSQYLIDEIGRTPNITWNTRRRSWKCTAKDAWKPITIECGRTSYARARGRQRAVRLHRRAARHRLAGGRRGARRARLHPDRPRPDARRQAAGLDARRPRLLETSVPGIFAVGDVRHGSVKRVASGVGEGSIAIQFVHQYLSKA